MRRKYESMLPSGDSQMQGGNSETGGRRHSPHKQEKPHMILQVVNKLKALFRGGQKHIALYDQKEYERGVNEMLIDQQTLLGSIPLDAMRNNSNKLVNQDMDVAPLEEMNLYAECILRQVAENMHDSKLMSRYVEELSKKDNEKWQQSQTGIIMAKGGETACKYIQNKAEEHLIRLTSRMEWFPIAYHLADKVALVVFPILGYYTGKYHLNDTMTFLWAMAFMPIFVLSAIWGINELTAYLERRKKK